MPLSKNDLQNIGQLIDSSLDNKLEITLSKKINPLQKDIKKIKKDLSSMLDFLDNENIRLKKQVKRIEEHISLPQLI